METEDIQKIIPHRYPFLLVDRISSVDPGKAAAGVKNVSANEWFFAGHFPGYAVMPGVLIIEALAQVGAVAMLSLPENYGKLVMFAGIDRVRFKREVRPGDQLALEIEITHSRKTFGKGAAEAKVGDDLAVSAELMFMLKDSS